MKKIVFVLFLIGVMVACSTSDDSSQDDENTGDFDRSAMLANWADNIILPGYADFSSEVDEMELAMTDFTNTPNLENLNALRTAWQEAYVIWQRVSMFEVGPAETNGLRLNLNIYPTNTEQITQNIEDGTYNLSLSSNRSAKGFPALDYLLFGIESTDQGIVDRYAGTNGEEERNYLTDIVVDIRVLTEEVKDAWANGYRDTFVNNDGASATASVDRFVNDYIFYFEKHLRAGKMGIPAGVFSGTPIPESIEAFYKADLSKTLFLEGLQASQNFFNGRHYDGNGQGESLSSYLDELDTMKNGESLKTIINDQFDLARTSVMSLSNFSEELNQTPPIQFLEAYDEVQRAVPLLKVDMVSAMSIAIDFVDADGD